MVGVGALWGDRRDTGGADMDGRNTRAKELSAQRRFLGGETATAGKRPGKSFRGRAKSGRKNPEDAVARRGARS